MRIQLLDNFNLEIINVSKCTTILYNKCKGNYYFPTNIDMLHLFFLIRANDQLVV